MIIDILFALMVLMAILKGLRKGFILGLFSFLSIIIGIAAAIKLSAIVAQRLPRNEFFTERWIPVISFLLVFIVVILLVSMVARLLKKTIDFALLGWLDRLGGVFLYLILYTVVFSILLFFAERLFLIKKETISDSTVYRYVEPFGPKVINSLGKIIPFFRDMFVQLENFFSSLGK